MPIWLILILLFVVGLCILLIIFGETEQAKMQGVAGLVAIAFLLLGAALSIWGWPLLGKVAPFLGKLFGAIL